MKHYLYLVHYITYGVIIILCGLLFASTGYLQTTEYNTLSISINLVNTYSGSLTWSDNNMFVLQDNILWTKTAPEIQVNASTGGYIQILDENNTTVLSGSHANAYNDYYILHLTGDGLYHFKALFHSFDGEPLFTDILSVVFDHTPPTLPMIFGPINNTLITGDTINFNRGSSTDSGIGFSEYNIHLSLTPDFSSDVIIHTTHPFLSLGKDDIPHGTIFWYIEVSDILGNKSSSMIHFFHNQVSSTIHHGGGGYTLINNSVSEISSDSQKWYVPEYEDNPLSTTTEEPEHSHSGSSQASGDYIWLGPSETNNTITSDTTIKDQLFTTYYNTIQKLCQMYGQCIMLPGQDDENHTNHSSAPDSKEYEALIQSYQGLHPIGLDITIISYIIIIFFVIFSSLGPYFHSLYHIKTLLPKPKMD